mmetsp:Transcript_446/g.990  ORF Transcript_446/g.990 Transcript_446/m.990 type:complete len:238 (-) Transcript_446:167-880(-)|eukprot:CAMPEP_0201895994 /NCGR_PEP_ID=MMETSP0902-20130614/43678_1 /ASSEMBLY_ACC=CAM_ASM_000551 /TAXON_ID=420261 /ORGANISM="Thalassiosira antarctica, Strain CCMP982" /LENGTH=237 /DNA_ID=CAMNT_0048428455 /DNA_START=99 /DNA_END=812 /DNA_ORIENTATION=-
MISMKRIYLVVPRTALSSMCSASIPLWAGPSLSTLSSQSPSEEEEQHQQPHLEQQPSQLPTKNIRLEAIKSVGITQLHNHTQDLISRTRQPLFEENQLDAHGQQRQSIAQIQEANRLESALIEAFAFYSSKHTTFSIGGQCIDVLGVEVSPDLKNARAYWCLPHSIDLHTLPHAKLEQLVKKVQQILDEKGGKIQALVHTRLRAYYPPKIKWVASEHVSKDMKRGVSLEGGKKRKWT